MPERQPTFESEELQQEMTKSLKNQAKGLYDLPNEVLLIIFAKLSLKKLICSSRVSKRIRRVCYDKSLWQKINLFEKFVPTEFIKQILENGCYYLSLCEAKVKGHAIPKPCRSNIHQVKWSCPLKISNGKSQLRYLDLSNFKNEIFVGELLKSCQYLEKLSLKDSTFCTSMMVKVSSGYLYFYNLEVLDLSGCKGLDIGTMRQIVMFEKLTEINFSWPPQDCYLTTTMIDYLVKNISIRLRKIGLNSQIKVQDEHMAILVTRCKEIRELELFGIFGITNNSLDNIMKGLHKLEKLDISLTKINLTKILELRSMPELQNLNCQHVKAVCDIERLKKRLPHLIINQKSFQIADRSQLLTPMKGFWDVHAAVVQDTFAVNE
jgi:hypothetical protein